MKILIISALALLFVGCGSSSIEGKTELVKDEVVKDKVVPSEVIIPEANGHATKSNVSYTNYSVRGSGVGHFNN